MANWSTNFAETKIRQTRRTLSHETEKQLKPYRKATVPYFQHLYNECFAE